MGMSDSKSTECERCEYLRQMSIKNMCDEHLEEILTVNIRDLKDE